MLVVLLGLAGFMGFRVWYSTRVARLFNAAAAGDVAAVDKLLKHGMSPNQQDIRTPQTILMFAAQAGRSDVVQSLLKHGANPNLAYKGQRSGDYFQGRTPLMYAVEAGNIPTRPENQPSVLRFLIDAGADVNARDANGQSALTIAVERAQSSAAAFLIEHGANANLPNGFGEPILIASIETSQFPAALLMIEKGADVNATDRTLKPLTAGARNFGRPPKRSAPGETPLMTAVRMNHPGLVAALIRRGAKLGALDRRGSNVWSYATNTEIIHLLGPAPVKTK
jgi:ankyrin repeat protein